MLHLLTAVLLSTSTDPLFTCTRDGVPVFSDRPCRDIPSVVLTPSLINTVSVPELTPSEQAQLDALARPPAPQKPSDAAARAAAKRTARADACADARTRLDAIREQRRKGYRLKDAARLRETADRLTRDIRRYCR